MGTLARFGGLRGGGREQTLVAIALGWLFILGARFLVPAVLPQVKSTFDVSDLEVGVAISTIWAAYALMQFPGGFLIDYLGERRLLSGSLLLTGASMVVLGMTSIFLAFLVGCGVFGLVSGLYGPARGTALSRTYPNNDGTAIGVTLAAGSLGSAVLPFLAGSLVGILGWRLIIGGLFLPLTLAALLVWIVVSKPHDYTPQRSPQQRIRDVPQAIRNRGVIIGATAATLMLFVFQGLTAFIVTYLVSVKEFNQATAAGMLSLFFIGGAVSQIISGHLSDRFGDRPVLVSITVLNIPIIVALPSIEGVVPVAVLSILLGTRLGIAPVSNAYIIGVLPNRLTGATWGILRTGFMLLGATGSTVIGAMADADLFSESFGILATLTATAAILYLFLPDRD